MNSFPSFRSLSAGLLLALAVTQAAWAAPEDLLFTLRIDDSTSVNTPTLYITNNSPVLDISGFALTIGRTDKTFDGVGTLTPPPGGSALRVQPTTAERRGTTLLIALTDFGPGETFSVKIDVDGSGASPNTLENFKTVFYNNGSYPNSVATVFAGVDSASRELPDNPESLIFRGPGRLLNVTSLTEAGTAGGGTVGEFVRGVTLRINNGTPFKLEAGAAPRTVGNGDRVQVTALNEVYKNIHSQYFPDSQNNDVELIKTDGEERFVAVGMSVNNIAQTADPTSYDFEITADTDIKVRWDHYYALTIDQDFDRTQSLEVVAGTPWAGPLESLAAGNPSPPASKQWVLRGTEPVVQVDGQSVDTFSHPGLDIRYVLKGYRAYGPPNKLNGATTKDARFNGVDIRTDPAYVKMIDFPTVEERQQVQPRFDMFGPGGIEYVWQIQYGVRVVTDDASRGSLAKVYEVTPAGNVDRTVQDGVAWFDPGTRIKVVAVAKEPGPDGLSLSGWANGDGYYFSSQGQTVTSTDPVTGLAVSEVSSGGPTVTNNGPAAIWINNGPFGSHGYEIASLRRPVRTLWRYGAGVILVNVTIGKHVFEDYPEYAGMFIRQPDPITNAVADPIAVGTGGAAPGAEIMVQWDAASARLYPTVPGRFTIPWKPGTDGVNPVEVRVVATLPFDADRRIRGHYPHIHGTPAVALDPDSDDDFAFKSIKFTTAGATTDANKHFVTEGPGFSVLLFSQIQQVGRGTPKEFLKVRVVDTRNWDTDLLAAPTPWPVGEKIFDVEDRANLGTGYVYDPAGRARYNPFVYDNSKLEGLAAKDIYDMSLLRADDSSLEVLNKGGLPGPVIPVNEHPGVSDSELPVVVWYDDPRINDNLMWPLVSRIYKPAWPEASTLPQIVIASQFGSEGMSFDNKEQQTAPAIGDFPAATIYDPSRLQSVRIYQQPNFDAPGYNPNEEHALVAPSLRFAAVSPRPPAIYALRDGDLNYSNRTLTTGDARYTSHPYVLVQFYDAADDETKMKAYTVKRVSANGDTPNYRFATNFTATTANLKTQPFVRMRAGEPVNPFYPLGVAIGASPSPETFGNNFFPQETYWEDWRGSYWSISGGDKAWFNVSFYYPLGPDFWWPSTVRVPQVKVVKNGATYTAQPSSPFVTKVPAVGDSVAFLPPSVKTIPAAGSIANHLPNPVIYKSEWPENPAILKAGETLTFSGGEHRADKPTGTLVIDGEEQTVQTPGLPQLLAFASAEVVFDSLNPDAIPNNLKSYWTARVVQALDKRTAALSVGNFPPELQPASGKTTVKKGKYVFNELPASLQRRLRYDPLALRTVTDSDTGVVSQVPGVLEFSGLVNDKAIGDATLTASPPAVYVLEPNILTPTERDAIIALVPASSTKLDLWAQAVRALYNATRNPEGVPGFNGEYLAGLMKTPQLGPDGQILKTELGDVIFADPVTPSPMRAFGPGLALMPNAGFLDPTGKLANGSPFPDESWVTVVENNDPAFGGSPITPHIIKVDRTKRYRGSIKTILSDNVFDENIVLRSTGDFAANADDLKFEWWYRPDDGSLNVPPPDLIPAGQTNPWKLFPDPTGNAGSGRYQITLKGDPNAPEALLADTFWFSRYRHENDVVSGTNWGKTRPDGNGPVNYTWAGAGNSQPFVDANLDGFKDFRAQLAQGWIKRVLDAVNPYEARIRDFEGDSPSTLTSMIAQFGARYEGPVALNPDKNVIENVGLIELYQTVLNRGSNLSINLSQPVSTPAISNALQLASTRISDFYTLLGNEAYADAQDPTIGFGSDSVEYGSLSSSVFTFQNQMSSLMQEELSLLRGVDDFFARPVYNRLFWNFTKGEGEAAYATSYNLTDMNADGFIDEDDAMLQFPQGHGDAWGHYLTAVRNQYFLLKHPYFNWVSRSESYNLQDIVITVDFLDERKFAASAAAKAKAGAEIVSLTYRDRYVADPKAQWQGYTDSNPNRAWGVDEWARRAGQGSYFDWVTANALLPSQHPNANLVGVQKVDRQNNPDIAVVSANLNSIQRTIDDADRGYNPLGLVRGAQVFDLDPIFEYFYEYGAGVEGKLHFDQIHERAVAAIDNAVAIWDNANQKTQMLRQVGNTEADLRNSTFQEDLSYRNRLIQIFGKPYEGTVGPGRLYPAGYEGPDLALYMYVPVRQVDRSTVPGPAASFASFSADGALSGGALYNAFIGGIDDGSGDAILGKETALTDVDWTTRNLFNSTFASASNPGLVPENFGENLTYGPNTTGGMFAVNYTSLTTQKVELTNFVNQMPVTAAGYTFQAPLAWGARGAGGELQDVINQMIQQEAEIAKAIGAWDGLSGETVRILRLINAKLTTSGRNQGRDEIFSRVKLAINDGIKVIETAREVFKAAKEVTWKLKDAAVGTVPLTLPTGGLAISPGDALAMVRGGISFTAVGVETGFATGESAMAIGKLIAEIGLDIAENELNIAKADESRKLEIKEWIKELEDKVGDEPVLRIAIFKEIQALRALSDRYRTLLDEGGRLVDERAAFNKRVAAATQRNRYQDMTFRVSRNHALQTYRSTFDLASRYAYLAASAYDYETNYALTDPASAADSYGAIIGSRTIGSLAAAVRKLKTNFDSQRGQIGLNSPQRETGEISMRGEFMRILPSPDEGEIPLPGQGPDAVWRQELQKARVPDLWQVAEFRQKCRPFASSTDAVGNRVPQPGIVLRFSSDISSGKNFFGKPLSGGDQAYSTSNFATKIVGTGISFDGYRTDDVSEDLAAAPRVYFVPSGMDIMRVSRTADPDDVRIWNVVEQAIPVPFPATSSEISKSGYIPLIDGLSGRMGTGRRFSDFRAYPDSFGEPVRDTRLIGRSIWNTEWVLIIPGATLNADPNVGLDRFVDQVTDIKLIFDTYSQSGE